MSILSGKGKVKLDGQKGLTKDKPILTIETPDVIYVPLVLGVATDFDVHVKEGDHVCIGTKWQHVKVCTFQFILQFLEQLRE